MVSKLEIMSQVMMSLKADQSNAMNNVNALLNNRGAEIDLIEKIKTELGTLSFIQAKMQECEGFMLQLAQSTVKSSIIEGVDLDKSIGSTGDIKKDGQSQK